MPTRPDPNSPFMPARLEAMFGVRDTGTPSVAGQPTPQAANVSYPAPPAVNAAPSGRPPNATQPQTGLFPAPPTTAPAATPSPSPQAAPAQPSAPAAPQPVVPPVGVTTTDPTTGAASVALSPEGAQRYQMAVAQKREELGPLPGVFRHPSLPELPVVLGKWNYNPSTGRWVK